MPAQAPSTLSSTVRGERTSSRALASLLLAAGVSALVVLADQWMDDAWAARHEIAAWLVLWGIAVAAIVLLRGISRAAARHAITGLDQWSAKLAQRRADERLWQMAQNDPHLMADLKAALDRHGDEPATDLVDLTQRRAARIVRDRMYYI